MAVYEVYDCLLLVGKYEGLLLVTQAECVRS
jgi:hypothetical protein